MKTSDIPASPCLSCGKRNDATTSCFGDNVPSAGDVTVCFYCGHIMVFNNDLTLRNPTNAEIRHIAGDRRILAVQRARKKISHERT